MTIADKIRNMDDEQLADFIFSVFCEDTLNAITLTLCLKYDKRTHYLGDYKTVYNWITSEFKRESE